MTEIRNDTKKGIAAADLSSLMFGALSKPQVERTAVADKAEAKMDDTKAAVTTASKPPATEKAAEPAMQAPATKKPADISDGREPIDTKKDDVVRSKNETTVKATTTANPPVVEKADEPAAQAPAPKKRHDFIGWKELKVPGAVTSPEESAVQHQEGDRKQAAKETLEIVARGFVVGKVLGEVPQEVFPEVTAAMLRIQTLEPTPREFLISKGGAKKVEEVNDGQKGMRYRWADPGDTAELEKLHDSVRGEGKIVVVRATAIERFKDSDGMNRPEWSVPSYFPDDAQAEIKKIVDGAEKK